MTNLKITIINSINKLLEYYRR